MERYLEQLIDDMRMSAGSVPDEDLSVFMGGDKDNLPFSEDYQHGPKRKLSDIVGILSISFPPEDQLDDIQTELLAREMELLLRAYGFYCDFPKGVPGRLRYRQLVKIWDDEYVFLTNGETHIEFCNYDESNCPFPGYCDICSQIRNYRDEDEEEFDKMKYKPLSDTRDFDEIEEEEDILELYYPELVNRFIPSIYKYCDRWCERCPFKNRCRYYYNENKLFNRQDQYPSKEEFLENLRDILESTRFFLEKEIRKRGIELREKDNDSYKQIQEEIKDHPLVKDGKKYSTTVSHWIHDHRNDIKRKLDDQGIYSKNQQVFNNLELIHWDHTMIHTKISRAIHGLIDEGDAFALEDANGSAKVALVLADRSLEAWQNLLSAFHEEESEIFEIIKQLKNLREEILEDFPSAPQFHRPGFDD